MASVAPLYNVLPTLEESDDKFQNREAIFAAVRALLAEYNYAFGLCLVHAHCILSKDEIMLARGNVTQPEKISEITGKYYPERWLVSGEPYEFTIKPTMEPPAALVEEFNKITFATGVLGLYHIGNEEKDSESKLIEFTEGRKNILREYSGEDLKHTITQVTTAWDLGRMDPVTYACNKIIVCDSRTTRNGAVHKGSKSTVHARG